MPNVRSLSSSRAAIFCILFIACASGEFAPSGLILPELELAQLPNGLELLNYPGQVQITYHLRVKNLSGEPITLQKIDLRTVGEGPYRTASETGTLNETIDPAATKVIQFTLWAASRGERRTADEPVTVRLIAYFDTPLGPMAKTISKRLTMDPHPGWY